jgi:hypothetical protein
MSDVLVSVIESTTAVTVTEQDVAVAITETPTTVTTASVGLQGIQGIGYTGVTSTSNITIGSGLKTFSLVSGYQGAFVTGMRIRAIHSDTPTYYMEGTANYVGGGTLIITVDKFNGSGSHNSWNFAVSGEIGQTGATGASGASGVISVTSPITNSGSSSSAVLGINQSLLSLTRSQISDFTSGTVAQATNASTAVYATTSGTAVTISGSITNNQISDFASGTVANISGTVTQTQVSGLLTALDSKTSRPMPPTGNWIGNGGRGALTGDQTNTNGNLVVSAFAIGSTRTLDSVAVLIGTTGTGSAGAVGRIGIWASDSNFTPTTLVRDCGTVALTGTAGSVLQISGLAQSLSAGVYWIGAVIQGAPTTVPYMVTGVINYNPITYSFQNNVTTATNAEFNGNNSYRSNLVTGTFASTPPTFTYNSANVNPIKVIWRFSA